MQKTLIAFRDTEQLRGLLLQASGPYGDLSKVIRAILREGLEARGLWHREDDTKCPHCGYVLESDDG